VNRFQHMRWGMTSLRIAEKAPVDPEIQPQRHERPIRSRQPSTDEVQEESADDPLARREQTRKPDVLPDEAELLESEEAVLVLNLSRASPAGCS
jgi:hypothetical protein